VGECVIVVLAQSEHVSAIIYHTVHGISACLVDPLCCSSTKQIHVSSFHRNVICSRHDIAEKCSLATQRQSLTQKVMAF
jgi:hypothetical protein